MKNRSYLRRNPYFNFLRKTRIVKSYMMTDCIWLYDCSNECLNFEKAFLDSVLLHQKVL